MIKRIILLTVFTMFSLLIQAQEQSNKVEIGFNLNRFHNDFGIGAHLISPYFLNSKVAVRLGANLQWLEYVDGSKTT